ncbi:MAG: nitrous oxide reductase family maturation protein NosD [Ignavibacteria bacterium]|nr:nitrous oxide reductase family maturation protein NosD [Ignavibacteria bacterium]
MIFKLHYIVFTFIIFIIPGPVLCKDIIVCPDCEIRSVKEAISQSANGDRIIIKKGIYTENNLSIDKEIEITGEDFPVIDLEFKYQGFIIKSNNVKISGLEIRNISVNYMTDLSAIKVENSENCVIENNVITDTFFALYLANSDGCLIKNNKISCRAMSESSSGNGIHLWKCNNITIEYNETTGHRDGIYFEFVKKTTITANYSHNNLRYGLHFMFSDSNVYRENTFRENGAGVAVMYTRNIEMTDNKFEDNWGPASYGLLLKDISRSLIKRNLFYKNTTGIYMEGCEQIQVEENEFKSNGWATRILGNCMNNKFTGNNFVSNTFDVSSNSSRSENIYSGNYWDKYDGYDLDRNGTGDVSYRPVSLYSMIVDKVPESIILLRSFIVELIDATEKAMPVLIPETLIDDNPKMKMIEYD